MVDTMGKYKKSLILLESVGSTNDWARSSLSSFCMDSFTVVRAMQQTSGKGISGPWHSPPDVGMYSSYVTFLLSNADLRYMAYIATTSILQMLDEMGITAQVKWPNDILISSKKIGGVLCETALHDEKTAVILGVGLNINTEQKDLDSIDQPATSLYVEYGSTYCSAEISDRLSNHLIANCDRYLEWGFSPFRSFLQNRLAYLGEFVQVITSIRAISGKLLGIGEDGALQIQIATGEIISLYSGRITLLSLESA